MKWCVSGFSMLYDVYQDFLRFINVIAFTKSMFLINQSSPEGAAYTSPGRKPWEYSVTKKSSPVKATYKSNGPIITKKELCLCG